MTTRDKVIEKLILKARGLGIHVDERDMSKPLREISLRILYAGKQLKKVLKKEMGMKLNLLKVLRNQSFKQYFLQVRYV